MIVKLLTEHYLEFLSLKGDCRGSSESNHAKMPHCWKSHALTHMLSNGIALFSALFWRTRWVNMEKHVAMLSLSRTVTYGFLSMR